MKSEHIAGCIFSGISNLMSASVREQCVMKFQNKNKKHLDFVDTFLNILISLEPKFRIKYFNKV